MNQEILNFSQMHAEPAWLSDLRQKAALEFENLELPNIERVKINRWGLDHLTISETKKLDLFLLLRKFQIILCLFKSEVKQLWNK